MLGGEQSGHVITLDGHVTGDGLAAALLLCRALDGGSLAEAAAVLQRLPQAKENVRVARPGLSPAIVDGGRAARRASSPGAAGSSSARPARSRSCASSSRPRARRRRSPLW